MLSQPTIPEGVYDRLPYLVNNPDNNRLIDNFTVNALTYFKEALNLDDSQYLDVSNYPICLQNVIPDLVTIYMLNRQAVINMQGKADGNGGSGNTPASSKIVKKAKAGEAEVEFMQVKTQDGGVISTDYKSLATSFIKSAQSKAGACGYRLIFDGTDLCGVCGLYESINELDVFQWEE